MYFTRVCAVCQKKKFEPPCGTFIKGESLFYNKRLSPQSVEKERLELGFF